MNSSKCKCKTCKGNGYVYPTSNEVCESCWDGHYDPEDKKKCYDCNKTGWVKKTWSEICPNCDGDGYVAKKQ